MQKPSFPLPLSSRRRLGMGLLESALYLGISGLILATIWVAASSVSANKQIDKTVGQLVQIAQNMRALYSNQSGFSGTAGWTTGSNITATVVQLEVVPTEMINPAAPGVLRTVWSSPVRIYVGPTLRTFLIRYTAIQQEHCLATIARAIGPGRDRGLERVVIDGTTYTGVALENLKITDIGTACNAVDFVFKLKS